MPIRIISLRNGFRRCGVEHPAKPVIYEDGYFSKEQVKKLEAEPMLIVEEVAVEDDKEVKKKSTDVEDLQRMTVSQLKKFADTLEVELPVNATKQQIVDKISAVLAPVGDN